MYLNGISCLINPDSDYANCELEVICNKDEELLKLKTLYNKHFDVVDALCYAMQVVKPHKDNSPIKKVIFNNPATIILWKDGTKTVVKCQKGDTYDKEKGFYMCVAKKALGNKGNFNNEFKRWVEDNQFCSGRS